MKLQGLCSGLAMLLSTANLIATILYEFINEPNICQILSGSHILVLTSNVCSPAAPCQLVGAVHADIAPSSADIAVVAIVCEAELTRQYIYAFIVWSTNSCVRICRA